MGENEKGGNEPKVIGKNWGKGQIKVKKTKKFTFSKKPTKSENEAAEIKRLQEQYETFDSSKVKTFKDIPLTRKTFLALKEHGYIKPTDIQKESIGLALRGLDILGAAKTGSGKTLAFIIPVIELLNAKLWTKMDGLGALIITPTRELAYQIFEALRKVGQLHDFSAGLIIGGKDLKFERTRMDQMNIIICTPGRLLQHMDENPMFDCTNLQILVLDEADRCLDLGFEQAMNSIIDNLPQERQTLLFSATQTKSVKDLARLSLKSPVYVSVHENSQFSTPESLQQSYIVCPLESKLNLLWSFLKHHKKAKILVFLSSCKQVRFVNSLFCRMKPGISVLALHGALHQLKRMAVYEEFRRKQSVVLLATDIAARGLDFPGVDWVIQLDCPEDSTTYIHRAGRTARLNKNGEALLVLLPSEEEAMIEELQAKKIPINKIEVNPKSWVEVNRKFEAQLVRDLSLKDSAQRAFKAYLKSVFLMKNKQVFDVTKLDLPSFASSLGLAVAPRVRFLQKKLGEKKFKNKSANKPMQSQDEQFDESRIKVESGSDDDEPKIKAEESEEEQEDEMSELENDGNRSRPTTYDFSIEDEDREDCDDLFVGKKETKLEENEEADEEAKNFLLPGHGRESRSNKPKSKAAIAKKILKKKIVTNKKLLFDDETGEAVSDIRRERQSELAKSYEKEEASGIDIEKAKQILRLEDSVDKKIERDRIKSKHKEERRKAKLARKKEKGEDEEAEEEKEPGVTLARDDYSDDSADEPDLSWLPDPDKVYGDSKDDGSGSDKDEENEASGSDSNVFQRNSKKRKAPRNVGDGDEDDEDSDDDMANYRQIVNSSDDSESESEYAKYVKSQASKKKKRKEVAETKVKGVKTNSKKSRRSNEDEDELEGLDSNLMEELALQLLSKK